MSNEFFYIDRNGKKSDAALHNAILYPIDEDIMAPIRAKHRAKYLATRRKPIKDAFNEALHPRNKDGEFTETDQGDWWNDESGIGGPPFESFDAPKTDEGWKVVAGQDHGIDEPPLPNLKHTPQPYISKTTGETKFYTPPDTRLSSGVIMREPDGRVWLVKPSKGFGGYNWTFPKGGVEEGLHPQANAIKEVYEESGLHARITGYAGDYKGDTGITRMYFAERIGGHPKDHHWETEQVALAHPDDLNAMLNRSRDRKIAKHHILTDKQWSEEDHPRHDAGSSKGGEFASKEGGGAANADLEKKRQRRVQLVGGIDRHDDLNHFYVNHTGDIIVMKGEEERFKAFAATYGLEMESIHQRSASSVWDVSKNIEHDPQATKRFNEAQITKSSDPFTAKKNKNKSDIKKHVGSSGEDAIDALAEGLAEKDISVDEYMNSMLAGIPTTSRGKPRLDTYGSRSVMLSADLANEDGDMIGRMERTIDFKNNIAKHDYLQFNDENEGKGLGKQLVGSQVALYQKMGLSRVDTHANIDVGGYAWARYGFVPEKSYWRDMSSDYLENQINRVVGDPDAKSALQKLMASDDPKALWAIADSDHGRDLLIGSDWYGSLDLKDPATVVRFRDYVSKRKKKTT